MRYLIGTRGSKLALVQTDYVIDKLKRVYPDDDFKAVIIKTTGDLEQKKALDKIGSKGIFVKEIEDELLSGKIHMAVHSMKDMPDEPAAGLTFAKAWKREDPRDVLVLKNAASLDELPHGAVIGTGSKRRKYQLLKLRPDLKVVGIRGNIDTRLRKLYCNYCKKYNPKRHCIKIWEHFVGIACHLQKRSRNAGGKTYTSTCRNIRTC